MKKPRKPLIFKAFRGFSWQLFFVDVLAGHMLNVHITMFL